MVSTPIVLLVEVSLLTQAVTTPTEAQPPSRLLHVPPTLTTTPRRLVYLRQAAARGLVRVTEDEGASLVVAPTSQVAHKMDAFVIVERLIIFRSKVVAGAPLALDMRQVVPNEAGTSFETRGPSSTLVSLMPAKVVIVGTSLVAFVLVPVQVGFPAKVQTGTVSSNAILQGPTLRDVDALRIIDVGSEVDLGRTLPCILGQVAKAFIVVQESPTPIKGFVEESVAIDTS